APMIFISVLKNKNIEKVKTTILDVYKNLSYEFSQNELNNFLLNIQIIHKPKSYKGGILHLKSIKQLKKNIPTFILEVNNINFLHFSYKRFIENKLRLSPNFIGCPINLIFKQNDKE
ncbi:MAG: ribosome biogenesis GTPase Der, partial [Mycoplasma sp.]|nr:ribosome biogenesis GTPase Der [Mycoplasma sp.]